ncbi:MAG: serine kinase [Bacteroidales bacterium]
MKISELAENLGLKIWGGEKGLNREISGGYTSDLLSDVMGHADVGKVWITLQTHKNVIAIASLKELSAVILVKGYQPEPDMLAQANIEEIPVLGTDEEAFEISGKTYIQLNH